MKHLVLIAVLVSVASLTNVYAAENKVKHLEKKVKLEQNDEKKDKKKKKRRKQIVILPGITKMSIPPITLPIDETED